MVGKGKTWSGDSSRYIRAQHLSYLGCDPAPQTTRSSSHTPDIAGEHVLRADTEVDGFDPLVAADARVAETAARQEARLQAKAPDGVSLDRISGTSGSMPIAPDARMRVIWARAPLPWPWPRGEGSPMVVDPLRGAGGSRQHTPLH
jgi:hypothetical protein